MARKLTPLNRKQRKLYHQFLKNAPEFEGEPMLFTEVEKGEHLVLKAFPDESTHPTIYGPMFVIAKPDRKIIAVFPL